MVSGQRVGDQKDDTSKPQYDDKNYDDSTDDDDNDYDEFFTENGGFTKGRRQAICAESFREKEGEVEEFEKTPEARTHIIKILQCVDSETVSE